MRTVMLSQWFLDSAKVKVRTSFCDLRCSILLPSLSISISNSFSFDSRKTDLRVIFCGDDVVNGDDDVIAVVVGISWCKLNDWLNSFIEDLSWMSWTRCSTRKLLRT